MLLGKYNKIERLLKELSELKIPTDEKEEFNAIEDEIKEELKKVKKKFKNTSFLADEIISDFFSLASQMNYDEEIVSKAVTRFDLGNPPGKRNSYGDSVIWETLLKDFPEGEDLYFVGKDNDFYSKLNDGDFSPFLKNEWREKKKSAVIPFKRIGVFVKAHIPEVETPEEIIKVEQKIEKEYLEFPQVSFNVGTPTNISGTVVQSSGSFVASGPTGPSIPSGTFVVLGGPTGPLEMPL